MRNIVILSLLLTIACFKSPTKDCTESITLNGVLTDVPRMILMKGDYPIRYWYIATDMDEVDGVKITDLGGAWYVPLFTTKQDTVFIPDQTNMSVYSQYEITGRK